MVAGVADCPRCGSFLTRLARRRNVIDHLFGAITLYPTRCQLCGRRFRRFVGRFLMNPRREYSRVPVRYPVWFRSTHSVTEGTGQPGVMTNLTIRGCRIKSEVPLPVGTRVSLEFQPSVFTLPITVDEAVVRSFSGDMVGLRFLRLHREEEGRIQRVMSLYLPSAMNPQRDQPNRPTLVN